MVQPARRQWCLVLTVVTAIACAGEETATEPEPTPTVLTVTSTAAVAGTLPVTHTCDGAGTSPPLS